MAPPALRVLTEPFENLPLVALRRTRLPALAFGVVLHLAILLTMSIGIFPFAILGCYPAFLTGRELRD